MANIDIPKVLKKGEVKVDFNHKKLLDSLKFETDLDVGAKAEVVKETIRFIIANNLEPVTSPMIREIVCIMLMKHGHMKQRLEYTRIGLPYFDLEKGVFGIDLTEDVRMRLIYDHVKKEYEAVKELIEKYD